MIHTKTRRNRKNFQTIPNNIVKQKSKQNIYPKLPINQKFQWLKKYLQNGKKDINEQEDMTTVKKKMASSIKLKQKKEMLPYNKFKLLSQHSRSHTLNNKQNLTTQFKNLQKSAIFKQKQVNYLKCEYKVEDQGCYNFNQKPKSKIKKLYLQNRNNIANILNSYRQNNNNSQLLNRNSKDKLQTLDSEQNSNSNRFRIQTQANIKFSNQKYLVQNTNLKNTKSFLQVPFKRHITQYLKVQKNRTNRCYTIGGDEMQFKLQPWKNSEKKNEKTFFADTQPVNEFEYI